jgi:hypothetical protein
MILLLYPTRTPLREKEFPAFLALPASITFKTDQRPRGCDLREDQSEENVGRRFPEKYFEQKSISTSFAATVNNGENAGKVGICHGSHGRKAEALPTRLDEFKI